MPSTNKVIRIWNSMTGAIPTPGISQSEKSELGWLGTTPWRAGPRSVFPKSSCFKTDVGGKLLWFRVPIRGENSDGAPLKSTHCKPTFAVDGLAVDGLLVAREIWSHCHFRRASRRASRRGEIFGRKLAEEILDVVEIIEFVCIGRIELECRTKDRGSGACFPWGEPACYRLRPMAVEGGRCPSLALSSLFLQCCIHRFPPVATHWRSAAMAWGRAFASWNKVATSIITTSNEL